MTTDLCISIISHLKSVIGPRLVKVGLMAEKCIQVRHVHFPLIDKVVRHISRMLVVMFTSWIDTIG